MKEHCVPKGAAAAQSRQIVAGRNTHPVMPALLIFEEETGFYVKSLIFKF
jgi:hypothetical protein